MFASQEEFLKTIHPFSKTTRREPQPIPAHSEPKADYNHRLVTGHILHQDTWPLTLRFTPLLSSKLKPGMLVWKVRRVNYLLHYQWLGKSASSHSLSIALIQFRDIRSWSWSVSRLISGSPVNLRASMEISHCQNDAFCGPLDQIREHIKFQWVVLWKVICVASIGNWTSN